MDGYLPQNINLPLDQRVEVLNTGGLVASPFTGAVSVAVLLFTAASVVTGPAAFASAANDANLGTIVTLNKPGIYSCKLYLQQVFDGAGAITFGISQDVAVGGLTAVPAFATAGMLAVRNNVNVATMTNTPLEIATRLTVSPEQADAGSLVRFHCTLSAGLAPALSLVAAAAYFRIRRINQLHA